MCRPCTLRTRTPLAQDGRQMHTCRAESALDGHSGFDHAVIMSVQTKYRGQCGMRAPLHRCTALPPGSAHACSQPNLLNFSKSKTERSGTLERSLTFLFFFGGGSWDGRFSMEAKDGGGPEGGAGRGKAGKTPVAQGAEVRAHPLPRAAAPAQPRVHLPSLATHPFAPTRRARCRRRTWPPAMARATAAGSAHSCASAVAAAPVRASAAEVGGRTRAS